MGKLLNLGEEDYHGCHAIRRTLERLYLPNFLFYTQHTAWNSGMHCFEMNTGVMVLRVILNGLSDPEVVGRGALYSSSLSPLFWYVPDAPAAPFLNISCELRALFSLLFGEIVLCPWGRGRGANSLEGGQIIPFCNLQPQLLKKTYIVFSFSGENMFCFALLRNHETSGVT